MTRRSQAVRELGDRHMEQQVRRPHGQSTGGLFRNSRKEVRAHSEEGDRKGRGHRGQSGAVVDHARPQRPC